jgi:hypothetical protein
MREHPYVRQARREIQDGIWRGFRCGLAQTFGLIGLIIILLYINAWMNGG